MVFNGIFFLSLVYGVEAWADNLFWPIF